MRAICHQPQKLHLGVCIWHAPEALQIFMSAPLTGGTYDLRSDLSAEVTAAHLRTLHNDLRSMTGRVSGATWKAQTKLRKIKGRALGSRSDPRVIVSETSGFRSYEFQALLYIPPGTPLLGFEGGAWESGYDVWFTAYDTPTAVSGSSEGFEPLENTRPVSVGQKCSVLASLMSAGLDACLASMETCR